MKKELFSKAFIIWLIGLVFLTGCRVNGTNPSQPTIGFHPSVKGCAETDNGMAMREMGEEDGPTLEILENTLKYSRSIQHQCCRKVEFNYSIDDGQIIIREIWSGQGCRCMCFSEIGVTLDGIPSGNYNMQVYTGGFQPGGDEPMEETLILEQDISIH